MVIFLIYHDTLYEQQYIILYRKISKFNASKELPSQLKVDLLLILWLNKVAECVSARLEEEANRTDQGSRQRRRKKAVITESGGKLTIPVIKEDLYKGIYDGKILAALLFYYVPHTCTWNGITVLQACLQCFIIFCCRF